MKAFIETFLMYLTGKINTAKSLPFGELTETPPTPTGYRKTSKFRLKHQDNPIYNVNNEKYEGIRSKG